MPASGSHLRVDTPGGVTVVAFRDGILLDPTEINQVEDELMSLVTAGEVRRMVIDCEQVQAISSQMISVLLRILEHLHDLGGKVVFCNLHEKIREAFEVTRLKDLFATYPNRDAAVSAVQSGPAQ